MQAGVFLRAQFPAGEHDNRHVRQRVIGAQFLQHIKAGHVGETQIEDHAVGGLTAQGIECLASGAGGFNLDIVIAEQFGNAHLLGGIIFNDEQAFAPRCRKIP